ncbi:GMC oxidoreductase-domain-containing protein [Mycena vitilis]|nr:GMC oxidoreductase-domain-containing protein [Mycena vitilis]
MSSPHNVLPEYDLVFAGGGTTACITASRLASAFPELSILVLESGPGTKDKYKHIQPGQYVSHVAPTSDTVLFNFSKPSEHLNGRSAVVHSSHCVGGGSSINIMMYNRPAASDFDEWETDFGNVGWGSKDLIPMLQKAETYEIDPTKPTHGSNGPLKISFGGSPIGVIGQEFVDVGSHLEKNRPRSDEGNGFDAESINTFFLVPKWIGSDGRRSDVAHKYVYEKDLKNLSVLDGCLVNRVVIEDGVAVGVEYLFDKRVHESAPQDLRVVKARKLVIVSGGAMGSPLILERSGVGKKEILETAGIPVVVESPGVGHEYQDHGFICTPWLVDPGVETLNPIFYGEPEAFGEATKQWEKDGSGLLGMNGIDGAIKMRPREEELAEIGPEFAEYWSATMGSKPDRPMFFLGSASGLPTNQAVVGLPPLNYMGTGNILSYPVSKGYLHIASSDPYAAPDFDAGFLTSIADVQAMRWAYKKSREIVRRLPSFRGAFVPAHPQFAENSPAALVENNTVSMNAPKVVYSAEDDAAIDMYLRTFLNTTWHSLGTCPMKPFEQGGVVDSKLNVYGVKNLKVADLSIPPSNVNANTYSTVVAIGEKAATIIAEELGGSA